MSIRKNKFALVLMLVALTGCAGAVADMKPGERPPVDTDEAGLWMQMDRLERNLQSSGQLVRDLELNKYVRHIVCRLAPAHCADIRVYVLRGPLFNASIAPNGMMLVWTGLLLRADNESQLAYILGHEISHHLKRHALQIRRDAQSKSAFLSVFQVMIGAAGGAAGFAGVPLGGQLGSAAGLAAQLGAAGSLYAFSRDNEREADELGFDFMVKAGYDPREAPKILDYLLRERDAAKEPTPFIFFSTHPPTEERIATLKALAQKMATGGRLSSAEKEGLLTETLRFRRTFLHDELKLRKFAVTQILLNRLFESGTGLGDLHFFQGELYRLRAEINDEVQAIAAYRKALEFPDAPAESHRSLGIVLLKAGDRPNARASLERYLNTRPDAEDREMIRAQLRELQ